MVTWVTLPTVTIVWHPGNIMYPIKNCCFPCTNSVDPDKREFYGALWYNRSLQCLPDRSVDRLFVSFANMDALFDITYIKTVIDLITIVLTWLIQMFDLEIELFWNWFYLLNKTKDLYWTLFRSLINQCEQGLKHHNMWHNIDEVVISDVAFFI